MEVKVGQLWRVTSDDFLTSGKSHKLKRPVNIKKYEVIEIRHPYAWHFRTIDNEYFHCSEEALKIHCEPYGEIFEKVRFFNKVKLKEIVELGLYENIKNQ